MKSIIFSGFGGQGIQFASRQLALAGMYANKKVTWMPAYGAESRGGTSNCTVIIADSDIGSPVVANPDIAFVMSTPAYKKFAPRVAPGGIVLANSSIISESEKIGRSDITEYYIPATDLAFDNDLPGLANLIMIGRLLKITGLFTPDDVAASLREDIAESRSALIELNIKALNIGFTHK